MCQIFSDEPYWGYELFDDGIAVDHFVQVEDACDGCDWFPGKMTKGSTETVATVLPFLDAQELEKYLVRNPLWSHASDEASEEVV